MIFYVDHSVLLLCKSITVKYLVMTKIIILVKSIIHRTVLCILLFNGLNATKYYAMCGTITHTSIILFQTYVTVDKYGIILYAVDDHCSFILKICYQNSYALDRDQVRGKSPEKRANKYVEYNVLLFFLIG